MHQTKQPVLIIDDEQKLRGLLARLLQAEGYEVAQTGTAGEARTMLAKTNTDLILCDVKLPDANGVELCAEIKTAHPCSEIILLTAYGNIPDGVQATRNGAFDYLVKGDDNDRIIPLLARAAEKVRLQKRVARLEQQLDAKRGFAAVIGGSKGMAAALDLARKVAPTITPVLITGETGTGKEVFAQAIHQESGRGGEPFVALNCAALGRDIIESELFGHSVGAFTGAVKDKRGLVEEAAGGTLFLDEIGELPTELQPKLLRFLETGTYYRVGDATERKATVRLIAATNRALEAEVEAGAFRSDLYYRIAVFGIHLPPLRERPEDVAALAAHYLAVYADKIGKRVIDFSTEAAAALRSHGWKGNVRELKNVIERAMILVEGAEVGIDCLPLEMQSGSSALSGLSLAAAERAHVQKILRHTGGNKAETARLLEIGIATLYRKMEEYGLKA